MPRKQPVSPISAKASRKVAPIRPLRSAKDLAEQIASGVDLADWEPEDVARLMEDLLVAHGLLKRSATAMEEDGRMRGESQLLDDVYAALGE